MGRPCGWLLMLLVLPLIQPLNGQEERDRAPLKYDGVYLVEGLGMPTVFVYVPESIEQQFLIEPDAKGRITGLEREFKLDGVPHRIAITVNDGRVESVLWDGRPLVPTTLTRQEINDIRRAADRAATSRKQAADPTATDEVRLGALYTISSILSEYPFLAMGDEPSSLVRYTLRAFDGIQLQLLNSPVEVQVSLVDERGMLQKTLRKEFEGGHTLEVHCSEVHIRQVNWNGKAVLPSHLHREYYVIPPKSISVAGLFLDGGSFNFQRRENGQMKLVRLYGKVLHEREKSSEPYYQAEDFSAADILGPRGKLITVFNVGLLATKPTRKTETKMPGKSDAKAPLKKKGTASSKSTEAILRTWTDSSGKFSVQGNLIEVREGRVVLQRNDGTNIEVPISQLSKADQKYIADRSTNSAVVPPSK